MRLDLVKHPSSVLKRQASPVDEINAGIRKLAETMKRAQKVANGVGLAACQLGFSKAMFTFIDEGGNIEVAINPLVTATSGSIRGPEACLSIPGKTFSIERPRFLTLAFTDLDGNARVIEATGQLARCFAHEVGHLNGILLIDMLTE